MENLILALNQEIATSEILSEYITEAFTFVAPETKPPYLLVTFYDRVTKNKHSYFKVDLVLHNRCHGQIERLLLVECLLKILEKELNYQGDLFILKLLNNVYELGADKVSQKTTLSYHVKYQQGDGHE